MEAESAKEAAAAMALYKSVKEVSLTCSHPLRNSIEEEETKLELVEGETAMHLYSVGARGSQMRALAPH